jgi:hypothetical protein
LALLQPVCLFGVQHSACFRIERLIDTLSLSARSAIEDSKAVPVLPLVACCFCCCRFISR